MNKDLVEANYESGRCISCGETTRLISKYFGVRVCGEKCETYITEQYLSSVDKSTTSNANGGG